MTWRGWDMDRPRAERCAAGDRETLTAFYMSNFSRLRRMARRYIFDLHKANVYAIEAGDCLNQLYIDLFRFPWKKIAETESGGLLSYCVISSYRTARFGGALGWNNVVTRETYALDDLSETEQNICARGDVFAEWERENQAFDFKIWDFLIGRYSERAAKYLFLSAYCGCKTAGVARLMSVSKNTVSGYARYLRDLRADAWAVLDLYEACGVVTGISRAEAITLQAKTREEITARIQKRKRVCANWYRQHAKRQRRKALINYYQRKQNQPSRTSDKGERS